MEPAVVPPTSFKFEDAEEAANFHAIPLEHEHAFKAGVYIAKAFRMEDDGFEWFVGKVTMATRAGPWLKFIGETKEYKQVRNPA